MVARLAIGTRPLALRTDCEIHQSLAADQAPSLRDMAAERFAVDMRTVARWVADRLLLCVPPSGASCDGDAQHACAMSRASRGGVRPCAACQVGDGRRRAAAVRRISGVFVTAEFL
ncbi:hypothetical protein F511_45876 [Dorcoceras hygrometricum]|uniref:Uncharacterized protein n=1 Tax=Dorcoceras hygrometricum TaxID=472368 RepID=A0A2Z6ZVF2_9LAMI|nr:hypothetical protein F511_45876 [Dorcoceras hygrometricum]